MFEGGTICGFFFCVERSWCPARTTSRSECFKVNRQRRLSDQDAAVVESNRWNKTKRTSFDVLFVWCGRWDLNPYVEDTRPSNVPVCLFQHYRIFSYLSFISRTTRLILPNKYRKVNTFFKKILIFLLFIKKRYSDAVFSKMAHFVLQIEIFSLSMLSKSGNHYWIVENMCSKRLFKAVFLTFLLKTLLKMLIT